MTDKVKEVINKVEEYCDMIVSINDRILKDRNPADRIAITMISSILDEINCIMDSIKNQDINVVTDNSTNSTEKPENGTNTKSRKTKKNNKKETVNNTIKYGSCESLSVDSIVAIDNAEYVIIDIYDNTSYYTITMIPTLYQDDIKLSIDDKVSIFDNIFIVDSIDLPEYDILSKLKPPYDKYLDSNGNIVPWLIQTGYGSKYVIEGNEEYRYNDFYEGDPNPRPAIKLTVRKNKN